MPTSSLPPDIRPKIGVVIPCYNARKTIMSVISGIGPIVGNIYVVDDNCPEKTGDHVRRACADKRVKVLYTGSNKGVGGAVKLGYLSALDDKVDIVVKVDADGQMDPSRIEKFIQPIATGRADYCKGNRFYSPEALHSMPPIRIFGNAVLSFFTKISSGYWNLMDPTNGYIAIHSKVLEILPLQKISNSYFFESDMLFRLNTIRAVVVEVPMDAIYNGEKSSMAIGRTAVEFIYKHGSRFIKRIFYNYFLREFNIASLEILCGLALFFGGAWYGLYHWIQNSHLGVVTPSGTVMLSALPLLVGFQLLLSAMNFDISSVPRQPIHELL
ncbi:MAG: glycosyltransferase family 2 protein [Acidiferrobacterales bacterium]